MIKAERWETIEKFIKANGYASVNELISLTQSSRATVRRDLDSLAEAGRIELTHGGAVSILQTLPPEGSYDEKFTSNALEKERIASAVSKFIVPGSKIIVDSGTTTLRLVPYLRKINNLTIMSNDVSIMDRLLDCENIDLIMIGGFIRHGYCSAIGYYAEHQVENLSADICIIGADAIDEQGISISNIDEVGIKNKIIESSKKTYVIADHSKFDRTAVARVCSLKDIDAIITGAETKDILISKDISTKCRMIYA